MRDNKSFDIETWLREHGYGCVSAQQRTRIRTWREWYAGFVDTFHKYSIYNGIQMVGMQRKSLRMAKFICEDWANLLLNEHVRIEAGGFQDTLDAILGKSKWCERANRLIELAFALGAAAFVEFMDEDGAPAIDFVRADMIFPLTWRGQEITECAFGGMQMIDGKERVYLMIHRLDGGQYVIENRMFDYDSGQEVELPETITPLVLTGSTKPYFQVFCPNIVNNFELDCPLGVSVFANSLDVLMALDTAYDSMDNEFILGRKRIFIPMSMARIQMTGQRDDKGNPVMRPVFDSHDVVFYAVTSDEKMPKDVSSSLRIADHSEGIQANLSLLGKKTGVGADRYIWDKGGGVKTATEVISEKSDLYQNLKKHEHPLESAIVGMVHAIARLCGHTDEIAVKLAFDDSIIQDSQREQENALAEVTNGVRSKYSYLADVKHLSDEDAKRELSRIADEQRIGGAAVDALLTWNDAQPRQRPAADGAPHEQPAKKGSV